MIYNKFYLRIEIYFQKEKKEITFDDVLHLVKHYAMHHWQFIKKCFQTLAIIIFTNKLFVNKSLPKVIFRGYSPCTKRYLKCLEFLDNKAQGHVTKTNIIRKYKKCGLL